MNVGDDESPGAPPCTRSPKQHSADTGNEPAPDKNDAAAIKAMKAFLSEGLKGLKAKAEAK